MHTQEIIRNIPKVELHDHLAGGLRLGTIIEIADSIGFRLPEKDPEALRKWFQKRSNGTSLALYLESFRITSEILQSGTSLERAAYEAMLDFAEEHIVYAEIRFSPVHHTAGGLSETEVVESVLSGLRKGSDETGVYFGLILCGMRDRDPRSSLAIAKLAVHFIGSGVVGFDIAGKENGYPPELHIDAFAYAHQHGLKTTAHAGEAAGIKSIFHAVMTCRVDRIGHGTRLIDDIRVEVDGSVSMGKLSRYVRNRKIPLEMCLTSNIGTGVVPCYADHPFPLLFRSGFQTLLCSDNRLMSGTSLTKEMEIAVEEYGLSLSDLKRLTVNAIDSAFIPEELKEQIKKESIEPGFKPYF